MLGQFQASYQRLEQSLERLTESIAEYNPSTNAADELVAADNVVNENLERLIHQSNHLRIQELRQTTEALDQTLRRTIQVLADTRKEIMAIPSSSTSEEPKREVEVDELLAYAKFISKTTVPPTFRKKEIPLPSIKSGETNAQITNGIATPPAGAQDHDNSQYTRTENVDVNAMNANGKSSIDLPKDLPFIPWPSQEVIQRGALADVQRMIDSGQDPGSILTAGEQAEVDKERKEDEEKARLALEEAERRRMSMFDTTSAIRRSTMADVFDPDNL